MTATVLAAEQTDYFRIKTVQGFAELVATPFANGVNALCWRRQLRGDFAEVIAKLGAGDGIVTIGEEQLAGAEVSGAGPVAIDILRQDLRQLQELDRDPVLNCIREYPRDESGSPVSTDVFSWHADSAPVEADTWLCTYYGAPTEGVPNEEALRRVDDPKTRAALLAFLGVEDDDAPFHEALREHCFDVHYAAVPHAQPYSFGIGNVWRIAVDWPGSAVPPCIHRAPRTVPGAAPRLLLIC